MPLISECLKSTYPKTHIQLHTCRALNTPCSCTAVGDSFQLCPCHSRYLPEYGLTMVKGMNSCGALSLTSSGLINALEQARTLTHFQSDKQTYTPPEWRWEIVGLEGVSVLFACVNLFACLLLFITSLPFFPPLFRGQSFLPFASFTNWATMWVLYRKTQIFYYFNLKKQNIHLLKIEQALLIRKLGRDNPGVFSLLLNTRRRMLWMLPITDLGTSKAPESINYSSC